MKNQELQLVTYEQAKKLKELGFDWECWDAYWDDGGLEENYGKFDWNADDSCDEECISAPTVALALKWFRDVMGVEWEIRYFGFSNYEGYSYNLDSNVDTKPQDTYEQAESALLDELLKLEGLK